MHALRSLRSLRGFGKLSVNAFSLPSQTRYLGQTVPAAYKSTVQASSPIFKEVFNCGSLFDVKDLPERTSKGKRYVVFEVRSALSPHLLKCATESLVQAGVFPGVFTRDAKTGKPQNIRFSDARKDQKKLQDIWLLVFVPYAQDDEFRSNIKKILTRAVAIHQAELSSGFAQIKLEHVKNIPDCVFSEGGEPQAGILYEGACEFGDLIFSVAGILARKEYSAEVRVQDEDGTPSAATLLVTVPSRDEERLRALPQAVKSATSSALKQYNERVAKELQENMFKSVTADEAQSA